MALAADDCSPEPCESRFEEHAPEPKASAASDCARDSPANEPQEPALALSRADWRDLLLLALAWSCSFSILAAGVAALSVAAALFSPASRLNTVPVALILFATAVANVPVAVALARFGAFALLRAQGASPPQRAAPVPLRFASPCC